MKIYHPIKLSTLAQIGRDNWNGGIITRRHYSKLRLQKEHAGCNRAKGWKKD